VRDLAPMTLADFASAPFVFSARTQLAASADAIFDELGDQSLWFPMMRRSVWRTGATGGVGAKREVDMLGFGKFREDMLVWDHGRRCAFTMIGTTSPLVTRMAEDWQIAPAAHGCEIAWTVAAHPSLVGRPIMPALRLILRGMFGMARSGLAKRTAWSKAAVSRAEGRA
jgi:hypothetical protein